MMTTKLHHRDSSYFCVGGSMHCFESGGRRDRLREHGCSSILQRRGREHSWLLRSLIGANVFQPETGGERQHVKVTNWGTQNMNATSERCHEDPPNEEKNRVWSSSNLIIRKLRRRKSEGAVPIWHKDVNFILSPGMCP